MTRQEKYLLLLLAVCLIVISGFALLLADLRKNTIPFEYIFFTAFILYSVACFWVLGKDGVDRRLLYWGLAVAVLIQGILVLSRPTLSDDMFRYVWDGRVQAHGISPYRYPPDAPELTSLRDGVIYPAINRPSVVTVYPPAAEATFALIWRIWPDNIHWFQVVMAASGLLAGILLTGLLRDLGRTPARVLIYLWSPLLAFETAHAAHVDGLVLPLLVGAWWARVRQSDALVGFLLGVATAVKFYPALLLPFIWRPDHPRGRWSMPLSFGLAVGLFYIPYILTSGRLVLGSLPNYLQEKFNISPLVSTLSRIMDSFRLAAPNRLVIVTLVLLFLLAIWFVLHPAPDAETALRRCIWPIGVVTLLSQDLFSWYMLWLLPLVAIFLEPSSRRLSILQLPRLDAWTGWWLFCGLIGLSYTFFVNWTVVYPAIQAQFFPLYIFLLFSLITFLWKKFARPLKQVSIQRQSN